MKFGCQSKVERIHKILIKHPEDAFINQENVNVQWEKVNFFACPDYKKALKEYGKFVNLLKNELLEIYYLPKNDKTSLDSIYTHDPVIITKKGTILCNMGKEVRKDEPSATGEYLSRLGIPLVGTITGNGKLEGGDIIWLDENTLVVGQGYRTNSEGIRQLKELTSDTIKEFVIVPLPHWLGPKRCLHLMSLISLIDHRLAVVYSKLLPVPFRNMLIERGTKLIEVPDTEFNSMACNVLTLAPRKCIMLSGNPITKKRIENEGVEVWEYEGQEISLKGEGGPTCLTRPILRE